MTEGLGPVRRAVRSRIAHGELLATPVQGRPFKVLEVDDKGVVLLLGAQEARTALSWECLEGVPLFLSGRGWVEIGSRFETVADPTTLDGYLKQWIKRATAGWVAVVLERAGVLEIDRTQPARVRLLAERLPDR